MKRILEIIEFLWYYFWGACRVYYRVLVLRNRRLRPTKENGHRILSDAEGNELLAQKIQKGEPFCVVRFGATEMFGVVEGLMIELGLKKRPNPKYLYRLKNNSGFFPQDPDLVVPFMEEYRKSIRNLDVLACYGTFMENYFVKKNAPKDLVYIGNRALEPYYFDKPWSKALAGKKVLIIHPYEDTIRKQYEKRELLFSNKDILPEFELLTLKAVQTVGDQNDPRFENWFQALDYMTEEALKKDFDIAIIGCGSYGLPLACRLREAGKIAIHVGGATQIFFGIKGERWDKYSPFISGMYNEHWTRPSETETPKGSKNVEGNSYW